MPVLRYWDPTTNSWQNLVGTGPAGPAGPQGIAGANGTPGAQGPQGPQGNAGPQGSVGPSGAIGPAGPAGADGAVGPPGPATDEVFVGPDTPTPTTLQVWFDTDATPTPLPQGPPGPTGPVGPTGPTGAAGATGATGPPGTSITVKGTVPTAASLPATANPGDGYITADTGHLWVWGGSSWTDAGLVRGPVGPTGPAGAKGDKGDPGSSDWADITNKPTTFTPATHNHDDRYYTEGEMLSGIFVRGHDAIWECSWNGGAGGKDRQRWYGNGGWYGDSAYISDLAGKANAWADVNDIRYAEGPYPTAYNRVVAGGGFFAVWMDNGLQFGRSSSSRRFKENIVDHEIDPAQVLRLQPKQFDFKASTREHPDVPGETELVEGAKAQYGLIAEEVYELVPELVTFFDDPDQGSIIDGVRYDLLSVALLHVVKDLTARVQALEDS